jgi:hypothetical protein
MKKLQISVPENGWGSLNTKYPSESGFVASNEFTEGTYNLETATNGNIRKRKGGVTNYTLPNPPKDQYEAIFSDGTRHLLTVDNGNLRYSSGDAQYHLVDAGLTAAVNCEFATTQDRVYFGNGVQQKVYDRVTNYGGVTYTFPTQTIKTMGCQAPLTAPTATLASGTNVPDGPHTYRVTFLYYNSEESNGGPSSNTVTCASPNKKVNLTSVPIGGYGVTARKIYRDNGDGVYVLIGIITDNVATTFSDTLNAGGTPLPDDNGLPPSFTLITQYLDKLFCAGVSGDPYTLFFSDTGLPDIFPSSNYVTCNQEDPITGMVVYLDRLVVFNRRSMGQLLGKTSDDFRYSDIQSSVGCVDNRSIQIRVIEGVPVLVWLSDRGFYAYNGNSVVYISDKIEDLVNLNIQQSVIQKGRVSQSDYTTFTQGVKSDGVNLEVSPGTITNKGPLWNTPGSTYEEQTNPKIVYDSQSEWENGTYSHGIDTKSDVAHIKPVNEYRTVVSNGTFNGTIQSGQVITLASSTDFTGFSNTSFPPITLTTGGGYHLATKITIPRGGTIGNYTVRLDFFTFSSVVGGVSGPVTGKLWNDITGLPGSVIATSNTLTVNSISGFLNLRTLTFTFNASVSAGTYWIGVDAYNIPQGGAIIQPTSDPVPNTQQLYNAKWSVTESGPWQDQGGSVINAYGSYTFVASPVASSGTWISSSFDSGCINFDPSKTFRFDWGPFSFPANTSVIAEIIGSADAIFSSPVTIGSHLLTSAAWVDFLQNYRYWKIKLILNTTDNRVVPYISSPHLVLSYQGIWESPVIDTTADSTLYSALTTNSTIPPAAFPGSVLTKIATSASPSGPWSYVTFGSHVVRQYAKIQILINPGISWAIPTVNSVLLNWNITSTFAGKTIDTGTTTPAGWDIFQSDYITNGGAVSFYMRSGPNLVTESGTQVPGTSPSTPATWYSVTNGQFPQSSIPTNQYVQWKAVITSLPDAIPTIGSVTVNWYIGTVANNIRCASIFYNKNYYFAAAEFGSSINNLLIKFDYEGKWRVYRGISAATFSYFFNSPYYGDAVNGKIIKFLEGDTDSGTPVEFQMRSRAFDFSSEYVDNEDKVKIVESVILMGKSSGASYTVSFSVDEGQSFNLLYDTSGNSTWTTETHGRKFFKYLRPRYTTSVPSGRNIMLQIYNNDTGEVDIDGYKMSAFVREQPPIITG